MNTKEQLEKALKLLGQKLERAHFPTLFLIVCGGSSLIISGLISRMTKDVDVVAIGYPGTHGNLTIKEALPFPKILEKTIKEVAQDLGLEENWLNAGPGELMKIGLPVGYLKRSKKIEYSNVLNVYFLGRYDQIHLKVYAAVDSGPGRHVEDLLLLKPSEQEMESAARWAMKQDTSEGFRQLLKDMMRKLKYETVAEKL